MTKFLATLALATALAAAPGALFSPASADPPASQQRACSNCW